VVGTERNDGLSSQLAKGRRGLARQAERYTRSAFERSRQHAVLGDAFRSNPRTVAFRSSVASERGALEKVRERGGRADQQARWSQSRDRESLDYRNAAARTWQPISAAAFGRDPGMPYSRRQTPAGDPDRRGHASGWREARTWSTSVSHQGPRIIKALGDVSDKFK
jgi:hypothetical protein